MATLDLEFMFIKYIDDSRSVHPWNGLIRYISNEIDDGIFSTVIRYSKDKLGQEYDKIQREKDNDLYFVTLENKYKEDVYVVLENIFETADTHVCSGQVKISDKIKEYRMLKEKYKLPYRDGNFVGREQLLKDCIDCLQQEVGHVGDETGMSAMQPVGVVLCGLSGMGKTSLAVQVCNKLRRSRPPWEIVSVNQRGKWELKELCADLIGQLSQTSTEHDPTRTFRIEQDPRSLQKQAEHLIEELCVEGKGKRLLIWLDDMDAHCDKPASLGQLGSFLDRVTKLMIKHQGGHVRLLITVVRKLGRDFTPMMQNLHGFAGRLKEIEVTSMTPGETEQIIRKTGSLRDKDITADVCERICTLCCGCPIAIRAVADLLREGCSEIIGYLKCSPSQALVMNLQLNKCIIKSLEKLDLEFGSKECEQMLVQLSIFQTAEFDLNDAFAVIHDTGETEILEYTKDVNENKLCLKLIELRAWHLLEAGHMYKQSTKESHVYSLHPLVKTFLEKAIDDSKELKFAEEQAKYRFLNYFYKKIQEFAPKKDKTPIRTHFKIEDKWLHIKQFYNILLKDSDTLSVFDLTPVGHRMSTKSVTLQHVRLWKIAQPALLIDKRKTFANKQAWHAKTRNNINGYVFWTCMEAENLMQQDRKELAEKVLDGLTNEIGEESEGGVQNAKLGFQVDWEWPTVEIAPVYAVYCATRGKLLNETKCFDRALDYLMLALHLLEGHVPHALRKTGKERISKREVRNERAVVENLIGVVFFNKGNFEESRTYHHRAYDTIRQELQENVKWHEDYTEYQSNLATTFHQQGLNVKDKSEKDGYFREAMKIYTQCIETDKMMKRDMTFAHGIVLRKRADIYYLQDDYERAIVDQKKSLKILHALFRSPNIHITLAYEKMASYYLKLGKVQNQQHKLEEKDASFSEAHDAYDYVLSLIAIGGLSKSHNGGRTYRKIKEKHLELLSLMKQNATRVKEKYRKFEEGRYDKQIEQNKMDDFDHEEFERKAQEDGEEFELNTCDDSDDNDDDMSTEGSPSSSPRSSSSNEPELSKRSRLDSEIEGCTETSTKLNEGSQDEILKTSSQSRRKSIDNVLVYSMMELGMGGIGRQQLYRDTRVTSQELSVVEYRVKDRSTHRPSVRDSGMGDSEEQEVERRRQIVRQSSVDVAPSLRGQNTSEDSSNFLLPQAPASSSVIGHISHIFSGKRSLEVTQDNEQPGTSSSTLDRRRSWLSASTGSGGSAEDRRQSWTSTGSQDSVTSQTTMLSPFNERTFSEVSEYDPEKKKVKLF